MKKIVFAGLVASSALFAGDFFVGADIASSAIKTDVSAKNKTTGASASRDSSDTKGGYGLKVGYEIADSHRFDLEYLRIAANMNYASVGYTYKHSFGEIKPFVGAGVGLAKYKEDFSVAGSSYSFDKSSSAWNLKGGLIYEIAKKHEIELGYNYIVAGNMSQDFTVSGQNIEVKLDNTKIGRAYIGYNYRF